ncbi:hypothetical protein [Clostridium botulinum]|uniref:Uncharacterized protein n=1 Tax=Clostridium botulinum CFSAN001627 TaxID=1232189 RepID=M1ZU68_CLOBO|nr:hypothetical protein [Clostridium botulinum]EKN43372.1 hypothetical protein CFSAN001627_00902 [Clostridium botulinum CFSAN001627]APC82213.1 hypothetical protein NPD12_3735 [Clostridium botulinum]MBY6850387.1 hypothetical protein [Clostridium botulinum]MBY6857447.1 hypothetical protein [Clostridium botulinum]MBY6967417.1 hypothetical protein [Clostridium botulinum]
MTIEELIKELEKIEDKTLSIEVSTGSEGVNIGRFYGNLYRVSIKEDYKGKRVLLTGELEED